MLFADDLMVNEKVLEGTAVEVETLKPRLQKKALCVNKGNAKNLASVGNMNLL